MGIRFALVILVGSMVSVFAQGCSSPVQKQIEYCASQASITLETIPSEGMMPYSVEADTDEWTYVVPGRWTSGFWPGELWYLYEGTGDSRWKKEAMNATEQIIPIVYETPHSHDVGFMITPSLGNAYRLTGDKRYLQAMENAADSLATLYNPHVGTILSWPAMVEPMGWPHNTIIDNMLNLELLFEVAVRCNRPDLLAIAQRHAQVTMENQFRDDGSVYHVIVYDPEDGHVIGKHTHQGWTDESLWARGQAWAVYGFTLAYRYTRDEQFLRTAVRSADVFLERLPEDMVPYWDFDAGEALPDQPKDCSATAIVASALLELQGYLPKREGRRFRKAAQEMVDIMSCAPYRAGDQCSAFLLHSTGHKPNGGEVDASINYADYYYLESLIRLKRLNNKKPVV